MPRNITQSIRQAFESNFSGDVDLVFLTIDHPDLDDPIRVVLNDEDFFHDGDVFIGFPFDIQLLSDDERPPTAQLAIQNVNSGIGEAIRLLTTPPRLKIELLTSESYYPYRIGIPRIAADIWAQAQFETGDTSELSGSSTGTFFADNSKAYRGSYSLRLEPNSYVELDIGGTTFSFTMHFAAFIPEAPDPGDSFVMVAFQDSGDIDLFQMVVTDDMRMKVSTPGGIIDSDPDFPMPVGEWVVFDFTMGIDPSDGLVVVQMNGRNVFEDFGLNTGSTPVGRGSLQNEGSGSKGAWFDQWEFYDTGSAGEDVIYVADKLFLTNVKVDAQLITGTIEGWDYQQRVWPGIRARQDIFPGLFV